MTPPTPSFAEACEQAARELQKPPSLIKGDTLVVLISDYHRLQYVTLLTRAAAIAAQDASNLLEDKS